MIVFNTFCITILHAKVYVNLHTVQIKNYFMTRINITKTNPAFIEAIKAEISSKKQDHEKLFSKIKHGTVIKLQKMKGE